MHNPDLLKMKLVPCLFLLCSLSMTLCIPVEVMNVVSHENAATNVTHEHIASVNATHATNATNATDVNSNSRQLLRFWRRRSPAPKPAPAPVAPKPVIKAAPKPAPAPAPAPVAPKPVIKAAPVAKPAPVAPKPVIKAAPKPAPAPAPVAKPVIKAAPVAKPVVTAFPIAIACDNEFDLYVASKKVGKGDTWTKTYEFSPLVNAGDVIAIDGVNTGGPAAFIGVFNGKVTQSADWKCTTGKFSNWNENTFDDSAWPRAVGYSRNKDNNIWRSVGGGARPKIPGDAEWLWTSNNNAHNRVFCRYTPIKSPVAPVASVPVAKVVASAPAPVAKVIAPVASVPVAKVVAPAPAPVASVAAKIVAPMAAKVVSNVKARGVRIYGNYCGPNYCGGQRFNGAEGPNCRWGVAPKDSLDACCRAHDQCCGLNRGINCNREILSCINAVKCKGLKCNVAQLAMKTTFSAMQNRVCGEVFRSNAAPVAAVANANNDVVGSVNNMHARIVSIIQETQTMQKREIDQNKKNVDFSQNDLDQFIMREDDEQKQLLRLQASIVQTNQSIARHYAQMTADSMYLQQLDLIKPQFLKTLDTTNADFSVLSAHVSKLVSDEHKKVMQDILSKAQNQTTYDTRDLAQAFLAHYEKYKHVLRADSAAYAKDLLNLKDLNQRLASGKTVFSGLKAEVARLRALLESLKKTLQISESEAALFVEIERIISDILSSKKTKFAVHGGERECAVSVLRSHIANGLV